MKYFNIFLSVVLIASSVSSRSSIDLSQYPNSATLSTGSYVLYWEVEGESIKIAIHANTTGWVGFGIGDPNSGSMPGADLITAGVLEDGTCYHNDRYALTLGYPDVDKIDNWVVLNCEQQNGTTTVELKRDLNACDLQDRDIPSGPVRILFAWGENDIVSYHGSNRGLTRLTFYNNSESSDDSSSDLPPDNPANTIIRDFVFSNATILPIRTQYICQTFEIEGIEDGHVIAAEAIISDGSLAHHMLTRICYGLNDSNWNIFPEPAACGDTGVCSGVFFGWAPGPRGLKPSVTHFPDNVGIRVGTQVNYALKYFKLEIHFDNPNLISGVIDRSGVRLTITTNIRQHDAGILFLGDVASTGIPLPAATKSVHKESNCPSECTSIWPHDIFIFGSTLHMHSTGTQAWTSHWTNDTLVGDMDRADFFSNTLEQQTQLDSYPIKRGDRLNTHCVYNTEGRVNQTLLGPNALDEMCMNLVAYYPVLMTPDGLPFVSCGSYSTPRGSANARTLCGPNVLEFPNPTIPDPDGGLEISFGQALSTCGDIAPSNDNNHIVLIVVVCLSAGFLVGGFFVFKKLHSSSKGKTYQKV